MRGRREGERRGPEGGLSPSARQCKTSDSGRPAGPSTWPCPPATPSPPRPSTPRPHCAARRSRPCLAPDACRQPEHQQRPTRQHSVTTLQQARTVILCLPYWADFLSKGQLCKLHPLLGGQLTRPRINTVRE